MNDVRAARREPRIDMDDELGVVYWMRKFKVPRTVLRQAVQQADGEVAAVARLLDDASRADEREAALVDASPYVWEHWASGPPRRFLLCCRPNPVEGHRFKAHVVIRDARGHVLTYLDPPAAPFSSSWEAANYSHHVACRWLTERGPGAEAPSTSGR